MLLRELAGLAAILAGVVLVICALVAAGWWALAFLAGTALVCLGVGAVMHRVPVEGESGQADDVTSP